MFLLTSVQENVLYMNIPNYVSLYGQPVRITDEIKQVNVM